MDVLVLVADKQLYMGGTWGSMVQMHHPHTMYNQLISSDCTIVCGIPEVVVPMLEIWMCCLMRYS